LYGMVAPNYTAVMESYQKAQEVQKQKLQTAKVGA